MRREIKRGRRRARRLLGRRRLEIGSGWIVGAAALAVAVGVTALLEGRRREADIRSLVAYARERRMEPVELIEAAGRANRIVFLGDVHAARAPKWLAADAIEALARGPGLDAVVLEIGADQQPYIDAYLASEPENATILFAHPRTLHQARGVDREFLEIYHRVWTLNNEFGPGRRIRILAADLPGWPPDRRLAPPVAARRYAARDAYMEQVIEREVLAGDPSARILIFMGGYHGLKHGGATLDVAGARPVRVTWLAARLQQRHPGEVFTILPDAPQGRAPRGDVVAYAATRAFDLLRSNLGDAGASFGLRVDERFDFLTAPILEADLPGLEMSLDPQEYTLKDVIDGYLFLGGQAF
ncbi:MAG TPA: hypothetical protein VF212_17740 [Longimicrobiales bacterium]